MARLPRLAVGGEAHLVLLRGHNSQSVFLDDADRHSFLQALRQSMLKEPVAVHAYALSNTWVWLMLTPATGQALGRAMQAVSRHYSQMFNRRHARSGTLWDGRFRSTVVQAGAHVLDALVFVDQLAVRDGLADSARLFAWSSARHHLGLITDSWLVDAADYWNLGNTPFDRSSAYGRLLDEPLGDERAARINDATHKGWVLGCAEFVSALTKRTSRPLVPRPRGRPSRRAALTD